MLSQSKSKSSESEITETQDISTMSQTSSEKKADFFSRLPEEILKVNIIETVGSQTIATTLARTCKGHHLFFDEELKIGRHALLLVNHVARGEQEQAEELLDALKNIQDIRKGVLSYKIKFTDIAGKQFIKPITAFQYAVWALDRHMYEMLGNYLSDDQARAQLEELDREGVDYIKPASRIGEIERKAQPIKKERQFNLSTLIDALRTYSYCLWNNQFSDDSQQVNFWKNEVGIAQRDLPAHVVNEYCRPDRSFFPTPRFDEKILPRETKFFNNTDNQNRTEDWFTHASPIGKSCAILRANSPKSAVAAKGPSVVQQGFIDRDVAALESLSAQRLEDRLMLSIELSPPLKKISHK